MPETTPDLLRKVYDPAEVNFTPGERSFVAWISTETVDHEGDVVVAKGIDFTTVFWPPNPVVMAFHDYGRWPLGQAKWVKTKTTKGFSGLYALTEIDDDPDSEIVWQKIKKRTVRGISIGFKPPADMAKGEWGPPTAEELKRNPHWKGAARIIRRCLLFEYSIVPIPMNPDALISVVAKGVHRPTFHDPEPLAMAETEMTADEFIESKPEIAKAIERLTDKESFSSGVSGKAEAKGEALGDLRETMLTAIVDRMGDRIRSFLWSLCWDSESKVSDLTKRLEQGCEEFQEAIALALLSFEPLRAKSDSVKVSMRAFLDGQSKAFSDDAKERFGDPLDALEDLAIKAATEGSGPSGGYATKDDDGDDDMQESFKKGDYVKCMKGEHAGAYGKVKSVHKGGMVPDVEQECMSSKSEHAMRLCVHKAMGSGHVETSHHIGVKCKDCERIDDLKPPPKTKKGIDPTTLPPLVGKSDAEVAAEQLAELRKTLTPSFVKAELVRQQERALGVV